VANADESSSSGTIPISFTDNLQGKPNSSAPVCERPAKLPCGSVTACAATQNCRAKAATTNKLRARMQFCWHRIDGPWLLALCGLFPAGCESATHPKRPRVERAPEQRLPTTATGSTPDQRVAASTSTTARVDASPPAPLQCIVKFYGGSATSSGAGAALRWEYVGEDGVTIPYSRPDPRDGSLPQVAIVDLFEQRYRVGPITAPAVDDDPGRVRSDPLFFSTFGHNSREVGQRLATVTLAGVAFSVHRKIWLPLERVRERLAVLLKHSPELAAFFQKPGGTFNWRFIAGTHMLSNHAWAVALDLNVERSHYWRTDQSFRSNHLEWKNRFPQDIVDSFEAEGFIWGGRWYHFDTMHFEYRPELIDQSCYPTP
jgi:hypothetical protein